MPRKGVFDDDLHLFVSDMGIYWARSLLAKGVNILKQMKLTHEDVRGVAIDVVCTPGKRYRLSSESRAKLVLSKHTNRVYILI